MKRPSQVPEIVREARQAHTDAIAEVERLEAAVLAGDETIKAGELVRARETVRMTELRIETARSQAATEEDDARRDAADVLADEVRATELPDIVTPLRQVVAAVEALSAAVRARNDTIGTWTRRARSEGATDLLRGRNGVLRVDGRTYAPRQTMGLLAAVLRSTPGGVVPLDPEKADHAVAVLAAEVNGDDAPPPLTHRPRVGTKLSRPFDPTSGDFVMPRPKATQYAAETAAFLRHKRDERELPFEENRPELSYPRWIDDADLIEMVGHVTELKESGRYSTEIPSAIELKKQAPVFSNG